MADVQIAIIEQGDTEITLAVPGVQGATGATGATGAITGAGAGSAAAPSISFAADVNTGLFNPSADTLAISTGGVERLRVNTSGTILGSVNAATTEIRVTAASGTDINGTPLVLRSGQSTGSGESAEIRILPSTGSPISGTTVRNFSSSGIYMKKSPVSQDHHLIGLLRVAIGSSIAQCNYSGLGGENTILTLDGIETSGQAALEIVGTSISNGAAQGFIRFFGGSAKNPYATIVATTPGFDYTSGNLSIKTFNSGIEGTVATFTNTGRLLVGTTTAAATGGVLQLSSGITFPATAVASANANTLDDYEEGTWTPTVTNMTTTGSPAYGGRYRKIGSQVTIWFFTATAGGVATYATTANSTFVSGIPFSSGYDGPAAAGGPPGVAVNGSTTAGGFLQGPSASSGSTQFYFSTSMSATQGLSASFTYYV